MKKKSHANTFLSKKRLLKLCRIMKLTILLTIIAVIQVTASTYSQTAKLTIKLESVPLSEVFHAIETQSEFNIFYKDDQIDLKKKVNINLKNATINVVLTDALKNTSLTFKVLDKIIVITDKSRLQITVKGKVTDAKTEESIPGVNIMVKGTDRGTISDLDGNYTIDVPAQDAVLVFSSIGFVTQEIVVDGKTNIDVVMLADVQKLEEVVVIGYGTKIRKEITGSVTKVSSDDLSKNVTSDVTGALQGRSAGVQITQQGGQPGAAMRIRVRGSSSINSSGDPLIVIDGIPVSNTGFGGISGLAEINSNDIESIEILKDAASAAIYGSRAANGVMLITTKKGKAGKDQVEVTYEQGYTTAVNSVDFVNGDQYQQLVKKSIANREISGLSALAKYYIIPNNLAGQYGYNEEWLTANPTNTNWRDEIMRDGQYQNATFSMRGGTEKTLFYFSGAYRNEEGILIGNNFSRYNGRLNVDHNVNKILKTGINISISHLTNENGQGGFFTASQTTLLPIYPMYAPNDPTRYFYDYPSLTMAGGAAPRDNLNPVFWRDNYSNSAKSYRSLNNLYLQLTPMQDLVIRSEFGIDFRFDNQREYKSIPVFPFGAFGAQQGGGGRIGNSRFQTMNLVSNTTAAYNKEFNNHKIGAMVGMSTQNSLSSGNTSIKEGLSSEWVKIDGSKHAAGNESQSEFRYVSYFGRLNYVYGGKYLAEFNVRRDGSNRFATGNRWGVFPGASVGWILTEEDFLKGVNALSLLKVRLSYGIIGNDQIGNFKYLSTVYTNWNDGKYAGEQGYLFASLGNRNLTWEKTKEMNVGLDFSFIEGRYSGTFEYYNKNSIDLLINAPISNAYGWSYTSTMLENVGTISSKGAEFTFNANVVRTKMFDWTIDFNIAHYNMVVEELFKNNGPNIPGTMQAGNVSNSSTSMLIEDQVYGAFFLPVYAGKDPVTGAELIYEVNQTKLTNEGKYELTGNVIDATNNVSAVGANKFLITDKSPFPKFFGGIGSTFNVGNFDMSFLFYYQYGNWIYDANEFNTVYPGEGKNLRASTLDALEENNNIPFVYGANAVQSTRFLHDGSFVRLRNLQIGYTLPKHITERFKVTNLRVYVSAQNLLTWTKFSGWDPEVFRSGDTDANVAPGIAEFQLPQVKTMLFGIKIGI